ncbi:MAG: O-antigen ligase family protein [Ignavibacteriales bacterium]|nr:O-antigen ligase family protein [Ignavibacteriales bacterium]
METKNNYLKRDTYFNIANISFIILIFFTVFGTALPFRSKAAEVAEIGTSNIINQIVFSSLFILSLIALLPKRRELLSFIIKEKFLTAFIIWCFLSLIWSEFSFNSFKRLFQMFCTISVSIAFLLHNDSRNDLLKFIKYIIYLYLILSFLSVILVPDALDPDFHTWRGLTSQKNMLGQDALISSIFCYLFYKNTDEFYSRVIAMMMMLLSIVLMVGSMSSTSILIFIFLLALSIFYFVYKLFEPTGYGRTAASILIFTLLSCLLAVITLAPDFFKLIPELFGKDDTFSGRTDLWTYMLFEISKHPWLGAGYQGFWVVENKSVLVIYDYFVWLPNQSHNGYIDIINEVGFIGFILFLFFIVSYFTRFAISKIKSQWIWFMIIAVISNFQESTFFRPGHLLSALVVFAYLITAFDSFDPYKNNNEKKIIKIQ